MRKLIDIDDVILKDLKVASAWRNLDLKNYIQELLKNEAEKQFLFDKNKHEKTACSNLDPIRVEFKKLGLFNSKMRLQVVTESQFIYEIKTDSHIHEIAVINLNMDFYDEMTLDDILYKTPFYLSYRVFNKGVKGGCKQVFLFRVSDTKEWKDKFSYKK